MGKRAETVSIIGGADGPTSIWVAGTSDKKGFSPKGICRRIRHKIRNIHHKKRRAKAEASIQAGAHTPDEVIRYMQDAYGAKEIRYMENSVRTGEGRHVKATCGTNEIRSGKAFCRKYEEQRKYMKETLIMKHKPELLGDTQIIRPESFDEESLKRFWAEAEARTERAAAVPEEMFPMDYHMYEILVPEIGRLDIEIEMNWDMLGISYSGSGRAGMRKLREIAKDIYRYYGVTEEDIRTRSERYQALALMLSER